MKRPIRKTLYNRHGGRYEQGIAGNHLDGGNVSLLINEDPQTHHTLDALYSRFRRVFWLRSLYLQVAVGFFFRNLDRPSQWWRLPVWSPEENGSQKKVSDAGKTHEAREVTPAAEP
jgi:hypothetical protein